MEGMTESDELAGTASETENDMLAFVFWKRTPVDVAQLKTKNS